MPQTFKFGNWLKGLFGALLGSAAHSVLLVVVDPTFSDWPKLLKFLGVSALISFALYVKKSPLFPEEKE